VSAGKNPHKYYSFSIFENGVNTSFFWRSSRKKNGSISAKKCCNLHGFGAVTGKQLRKYQDVEDQP
jgi:hypothetical protein